jgi:hypothetical protein
MYTLNAEKLHRSEGWILIAMKVHQCNEACDEACSSSMAHISVYSVGIMLRSNTLHQSLLLSSVECFLIHRFRPI